ncbi:peptidyl-tRNA hydrolase, PTH2 family [Paragonimus westermani]|uniref:peptidyl-tRNA hydrolase n=1 Tax=Paragonimus westermani TaxID=34504 RepID=A0A5J4NAH3_9TREM|nr:peptidyl-tRNA hydrolase, PTH2 family [Paragonimus westermani]
MTGIQGRASGVRDCGPMSLVIVSSFISGSVGLFIGWFFCKRFTSIMPKTTTTLPIRGKTKMVLVVRTDLNMGKGKIAAQCSHAALDCFQYAQEQNPSLLAAWEEQGQPKIVLKSDSLQELELLSTKADSLGLVNSIIHDAGHTQVAAGTATVLGIGPGNFRWQCNMAKKLRFGR